MGLRPTVQSLVWIWWRYNHRPDHSSRMNKSRFKVSLHRTPFESRMICVYQTALPKRTYPCPADPDPHPPSQDNLLSIHIYPATLSNAPINIRSQSNHQAPISTGAPQLTDILAVDLIKSSVVSEYSIGERGKCGPGVARETGPAKVRRKVR